MSVRYIAAITLIASSVLAETRFDEFKKKNASPKEPVKVLHAGLLGGAGTEWLTQPWTKPAPTSQAPAQI